MRQWFCKAICSSQGEWLFLFSYLARAEPGWAGVSSLGMSEELAGQTGTSEAGLTSVLSLLKPHPMSLGTDQVSHWPCPKGLRASVLSEALEQVRGRKIWTEWAWRREVWTVEGANLAKQNLNEFYTWAWAQLWKAAIFQSAENFGSNRFSDSRLVSK